MPRDIHKKFKTSADSLPRLHTSLPSKREPLLTDDNWPWLYSAVLGNGRLLACLDENGSLAQLFYPHVDAGPHMHLFLIGIQVHSEGLFAETGKLDQEVLWLASTEWTHKLSYMEDAAVAHCISTHRTLPIQIDQEIFVHHSCDALINEITFTNLGNVPIACKLVVYAGFDFNHRPSGQTCHFHTDTSSLTFFADDRYVAITSDKPVDDFDCGRGDINDQNSLFQRVSRSQFYNRAYAFGRVQGGVSYNLGQVNAGSTITSQINMCFGGSFDDIGRVSAFLTQSKPHAEEIAQWWRARYMSPLPGITSATVRQVYNRSLITLKLLTDSQTGGIVAAPEFDPDFQSCGGYGFCWPRDGAFIGYTLDTVGQHEHARSFYDWALRTQEASGGWYQRYYIHGTVAPTWGLVQFDEIGAVVWAICRHIQRTEDLAYGQKVFSQLAHACEYMQKELDAETGLAPLTWDLWEEREGISTYACACTWAAFDGFAHLAARLGLTSEAEQWIGVATQFKDAIEKHLWDASEQRFLRGIKTRIPKHILSDASLAEIGRSEKAPYLSLRDTVVDASILGLSVPFGVFPANDPRMIATASAVARHLTSPVEGIVRYKGDQYRGGNPWIICTLWLALQYLSSGYKEQGYDLYNWALKHRTSLDLFSEQIDSTTGQPCWAIPLAWSHAMFLLATEECVKHGLLK